MSSSPLAWRRSQVSSRPISTIATPIEERLFKGSFKTHIETSSPSEFWIKSFKQLEYLKRWKDYDNVTRLTQCTEWFHDKPACRTHPGQAKFKDPNATASVHVATNDPKDPLSTAAWTAWRILAAAASGYPVKLRIWARLTLEGLSHFQYTQYQSQEAVPLQKHKEAELSHADWVFSWKL